MTGPSPHRAAGKERVMRFARDLEDIAKEGPQWQDRPDRERDGPDRWGKSHWALLGNVDERMVKWHGLLNWDHIQVSRKHWPMLYAARKTAQVGFGPSKDGAEYGLRLKPSAHDDRAVILADHCEVDALMDLVDAGLVIELQVPRKRIRVFQIVGCRVWK